MSASIWTQAATRDVLASADDVFRRWLGDGYDLDAFHAVAAAVAVERLGGDAPWLLIVSGSGNAKTETVSASEGAGARITSTITSEGALLSATSKRERAQDATGGLLRDLGERGVLVIKDVTSILSMNRDARAAVLGALREVADGYWQRNVGSDGGRSLTWRGRIVTIGAVTTAWDTHHGVIATMGDRFLLLRVDSAESAARRLSGRQALANIEHEDAMRAELRAAFADVIAAMDPAPAALDDDEADALLTAADIVTLARTAVERDYQGNPIDAHAPEAPTRLVKYLGQIVRGAVAIGMPREEAMRLALRIARDCMPPLRMLALRTVALSPRCLTSQIAEALQKPRKSVDRALQELHLLGLLAVVVDPGQTSWRYVIADGIEAADVTALTAETPYLARKVITRTQSTREESPPVRLPSDIPGQIPPTSTALDPGDTSGRLDPWQPQVLS